MPGEEHMSSNEHPLFAFLEQAAPIMRVAPHAHTVARFRSSLPDGYVATLEKMRFWRDVVTRVELVNYCYQRLCELSPAFFKLLADEGLLGVGTITVSPKARAAKHRWELETDAMTVLIYYELKSVVDLLRQEKILFGVGSEMEYVLGVRNKILAHPQLDHLVRSKGPSSVPWDGGPVRKGVANIGDDLLREFYEKRISSGQTEATGQERTKNELLIRSKTKVEKFTAEEIARLQAYGIREPDLHSALKELCNRLRGQVVSRIEECYDRAVAEFDFIRY